MITQFVEGEQQAQFVILLLGGRHKLYLLEQFDHLLDGRVGAGQRNLALDTEKLDVLVFENEILELFVVEGGELGQRLDELQAILPLWDTPQSYIPFIYYLGK